MWRRASGRSRSRERCLYVSQGLIAQRTQAGFFQIVAVEHVVGVEGYQALSVGVRYVDAGLLDRSEIESLCIDELHDEDAEEIFVAERFGREDLGQATEQLAQGAGLRLWRVVGGKEFEDVAAQPWVLFDR